MSNKRSYFNSIAPFRKKQRRAKRYYWNDITNYCNFFITPDLSVLEVGCGTGEFLDQLNTLKKTGIDFSERMIEEARSQFPEIELFVMPAENIQLPQKYDVIILSNLIGYLDDIEKVFEQLHKVSHPHTKIIISYYNYLWEPLLKFGELIGYKTRTPNQNWLSLSELNSLLFYSGFQVYRNSRSMLLPVYIPVISEIMNIGFAKLPLLNRLCINNYTFAKPMFYLPGNAKDYSVSVIVPARNESGNIQSLLERIPLLGTNMEVILVESGSTDGTWQKIEELKDRFQTKFSVKTLQLSSKGKANAVNAGFDIATGDVLMILDADMTVAPEDLVRFYLAISENKGDFIYGSRLVYQMEKEAMRFLNLLGNKFFSLLFTWLLDQRFKDTLCGTKVLFRRDYERLKKNRSYFGNFDPFGDFDLLFGAYKLNLCMLELPVKYHERKYGRTNISRFKHGILLLSMCVFAARKIKFRK